MDGSDIQLSPAPAVPAPERVAVLVTAFRIGPVLSDTLLSALSQRHLRPCAVLLVVDGCPETETTGRIARRFLAAYPGLFHVLWLENGGVARARNEGLKWLLARDPDLAAVYCLDGDDLIPSTALATGLAALRAGQAEHPGRKIGWVVANKQNFGDNMAYIETPQEFRKASYLSVNLSQPSCLYNADLFRDGIWWDETMRQGIEDWEFWLAAAEAGYEGVFNPRDLLYYRQLMGNRSSVNRRNDALTIPYMRRKHAALFDARAILAQEHARHPRYAFGQPEAEHFDCVSDPDAAGEALPRAALLAALAGQRQRRAVGAYLYDPYFPDILCLMAPETRAALAAQGLLRGLLMTAETLISQGRTVVEGVIAAHSAQDADEDAGMRILTVDEPQHDGSNPTARWPFLLLKPSALLTLDAEYFSPGALAARSARMVIRSDRLVQARAAGELGTGMTYAGASALLNGLLARLAPETRIGTAQIRGGRLHISARQIAQHAPLTQGAINTLTLFPHLPRDGITRIALIWPLAGGAPRARLLAALAGLAPGRIGLSLFVPEPELPEVPAGLAPHVENLVSLAPWMRRWQKPAGGGHRMGVPRWEDLPGPLVARLAGMFAPFDHVITHDLQRLAPVMLQLRSLGVHTVHCEPLADPLREGEDPLAALTYAAAYRRIICMNGGTADRLGALGYPRARLDRGMAPYLAALADPGGATA